MRRTCNPALFLFILLLTIPFSTALAQGTDVIRNGSFTNGLNEWIVSPKADPSWNPLENGRVNLHPPTSGVEPFKGTVIYQNLNVTNIGGKTLQFSMDLLKNFPVDGKTINVDLHYVKTDNTPGMVEVDMPSNDQISGDPQNPTVIARQVVFPANARKLVRIEITKEGWGEFSADNVRLLGDNVTVGPVPLVTGLSTKSGAYGSQLIITGANFGGTQGFVSMAGSAAGIQVNSWSDTSVTVTVQDPARSGRVCVIADYVQSNIDKPFFITSPNFTIDVVKEEVTAVKGQTVEYVIRADFHNGFAPGGSGIAFAVAPASLPAGAVPTFIAAPLKNQGGVLLKINTTNVAPGDYTLQLTATATGLQPRNALVLLEVVTIQSIRFYNPSTGDDVTSLQLSRQGQFNGSWPADFDVEALDSNGNRWDLYGGAGSYGNSPITMSSSNPLVVLLDRTHWSQDYYALSEGTANLIATAADGTQASLPVTVAIPPGDPKITSIVVSPTQVHHNYTGNISFSATANQAFMGIGFWSSGALDFRSTFLDNPQYTNGKTSVTSTFQLGNQDGPQEPNIFRVFLYATASTATSYATLDIIPDPAMSQLKGGVRLLDDMFAENFRFEFYDPATGNKMYEREVGLYHRSDFHLPGIPLGSFKVKAVYWDSVSGQEVGQWYPNAATMGHAQALTFTAGAAVENVYFFLSTPGIRGAAVYNGTQQGPIRVAIKAASDVDLETEPVTASAGGTFSFPHLPDGGYYVYAYVDANQDQQYTSGEAYGYYHLAGQGLSPVEILGRTSNILLFLEDWTGNTGISGAATSYLGQGVTAAVSLFPPGVLPINIPPGPFENPEDLSGKDFFLAAGTTTNYQVLNFDYGSGPPLPPGTYDVVLITGIPDGPFESVVIQGVQQGVQIVKGSVTPNINFTVNPGATVGGTVTSDAPEPFPLARAEVMLFSYTGPPQSPLLTLRAIAETDYQGHYNLNHVAPGNYILMVHADGFEDMEPVLVTISSAGQVLTQNVSLSSFMGYALLSVTIRDGYGNPITGDQRVYLLESGEEEPVTFLAHQGGGVFSSYVLPGSYTLVASARGHKPYVYYGLTLDTDEERSLDANLPGPESALVPALGWLLGQQNPDGSFGPPHDYIFGWSGYAALALLSVQDNPNLNLSQDLRDRIANALDDEAGSDGKFGVKQYFLATYQSADNPGTPWNDVGAFVDGSVRWAPVAATPVALERLISLGLPIDDPRVSAAVQFLKNAQVTSQRARDPLFVGGWRYNPNDTDADNWESPWVIMALMKAGLNPTESHVAAGLEFIRRSQILEGENAGMFKYMPDQGPYYTYGASSACMVALNFAGVPRNDPAVDLFFQWARNNPYTIHAWERGSNAYHWAMLSWAAALYPDKDNPAKTEYETLYLTWNLADHIYQQQSWNGAWYNPAPSQTGSRSANEIMFTASAIMALAPYPAPLAPPEKKTISGTVQSHTAVPLENALVEAVIAQNAVDADVTAANGSFELQVPVGYAYTLRVTAAGYAKKSVTTGVVNEDLTGQDISFEVGDIDNVAPTIGTLTPSSGSTVTTAAFEISAVLGDDHAGIDPRTIVMRLDGNPVPAVYDQGTGKVLYMVAPGAGIPNGVHTVTVDVKDYAQNPAVKAEWSFTLDRWLGVPGDLNNSGAVDLEDLILGLKVLTGGEQGVRLEGDVNGDGRIGMTDVLYILQASAGLR